MSKANNKIKSETLIEENRSKQSLVLNILPIAFYTTKASGGFKLT